MTLKRLTVPKNIEEQSNLLVRSMSVGWAFNCECSGNDGDCNITDMWFDGEIVPPDWIDEKFGTQFGDDENQEIDGVSVIEGND